MNDSFIRSIVFVAAFTALIVVGGIFAFPAPWNPVVPLTLATLFVILAGMVLGPWLGMLTVGLYLLLGILGLPVFSGGSGGLQVIVGPTGGFLLGYIFAAFLSGISIYLLGKSIFVLILAAVLGTIAIYIPGIPWMHWQLMDIVDNWSWTSTWVKYTAPFLIGDAIKAAAAVCIAHFLKDRVILRPVA